MSVACLMLDYVDFSSDNRLDCITGVWRCFFCAYVRITEVVVREDENTNMIWI